MKPLPPGPTVRFMLQNINQLGGDLNSGNIRCRRCYTRQGGGFDPNYGILLCANHLQTKSRVEDTMAHGDKPQLQHVVHGKGL